MGGVGRTAAGKHIDQLEIGKCLNDREQGHHHGDRQQQRPGDVPQALPGIRAINRRRFAEQGVFAVNLMSSPGSGKTTLLVKTAQDWRGRAPMAVIEGDQQTSLDAGRIRAAGLRAGSGSLIIRLSG